jgi:TetR/AcrR family fatty acid metabolism transcriptional regulator
MREYVPVKFAEYLNIISRVVREGQDRGVFRDNLLPGVIKRALFGALDELMVYLVMTAVPKYEIDTLVDQCSELFIRGLSA